jgi:hypothetical protein
LQVKACVLYIITLNGIFMKREYLRINSINNSIITIILSFFCLFYNSNITTFDESKLNALYESN